MNNNLEKNLVDLLNKELRPALGCTEPIAIAYACAKVRDVLGEFPTHLDINCSGNIIKNVKSVTVPNSNGLSGIEVAATLGVVGGNAERELEVLEEITDEHIEKSKQLIKEGFVSCHLKEGVANLYIDAIATSPGHSAQVTLINRHTFITKIIKDGEVIFSEDMQEETNEGDLYIDCNIKEILEFADTVDISLVKEVLDNQIEMNSAIAKAGLSSEYGSKVGSTLMDIYGNNVEIRARAMAAAGSDARMDGCSMPVVINSGSGNQGMTVSLPVIEYAKELNVSKEKLYRALIISNLVSLYQKHFIGSLSAFCGAVTAASGCGAAITYLYGGSYEQISQTIVNTLANVGGIICDGAKASCAAKIASAVDAAIMAHHLSMAGLGFKPEEGIVQDEVDDTIKSVGYVGREGMKKTDVDILNIMLKNVSI